MITDLLREQNFPGNKKSTFGFKQIVASGEKFTASKGRELVRFGGHIHPVPIPKPSRGRASSLYKSYSGKRNTGGAVMGLPIPAGLDLDPSHIALETIVEESGEGQFEEMPAIGEYGTDEEGDDESSSAATEGYQFDKNTLVTDSLDGTEGGSFKGNSSSSDSTR